ncbi:MAG: DNA-processing protein DprA [Paracoccus sp. (in: a-proteobacteria)]|nr:DNA-processing protein DprA [Paracoccus sp. (in: a-proteobacteria)]
MRLIRSRRVGPATFHRMLAEHGSAAAALDALPDIARQAGIDNYAPCPEAVALAEIKAGRKAGARLIRFDDPAYPAVLRDIPDAPPLIWVKGNPAALGRAGIAVVGARSASSLGLRMARGISAGLGAAGAIVIAGLARGIDSAAHEAALRTGTLAVMAGGIDVIYPAENRALAAMICQDGCLVSEQPPGMAPVARHFPLRNRIISGLSHGVVVIEAALKSGSLITARDALDQGREVMAVPGHPIDARAGGCNQILRDGAILVRSAEDVLEALPGLRASLASGRADHMVSDRDPPPAPARAMVRQGRKAASPRPDDVQGLPPDQTGCADAAPRTAPPAGDLPAAVAAQIAPHRPCLDLPHRGTGALGPQVLMRLSHSPIEEDALIRDLALPPARLAPVLLQLELEGRLTRLPGGRIALT